MSSALETVFKNHYRWFLNYAKKQLGGYHWYMGEDIVQEAFTRVLSHAYSKNEEEFRKILFRAIHNLVIDFKDHAQTRLSTSLDAFNEGTNDSDSNSTLPFRVEESYDPELDNMVYLKELRAKIAEGLGTMTEKQSSCIVTHYLQDNSVKETARLLNIANSSVTTHLSRGRASLLCTLEDFRP